jgi:hypothetical protein
MNVFAIGLFLFVILLALGSVAALTVYLFRKMKGRSNKSLRKKMDNVFDP